MTEPTPETTKAKPQKRPETRVRDAVRIARDAGHLTDELLLILNAKDPKSFSEHIYGQAEANAADIMKDARVKRDFGREVGALDPIERAMVAAGVAAQLPSA